MLKCSDGNRQTDRQKTAPPGSHVIQLTGTIFELNSHIKETKFNVLTKFHEHWAKNVTSRVFTCFHYIHTVQPTRHKHNPRLHHGQIKSTRRPNRVFTWRIALAFGIDPRNYAESMLKAMAKDAGFLKHKRITNHSVRKFLVQKLRNANIPPTETMAITGHKNARSRLQKIDSNPAESVTLEPDVFHTAGIAVFSKMQRSCHPLFIVESSLTRTCQRSRLKRDGDMWRKYGADQNRRRSWRGNEACLELRGGGLIEGPRDSGTQYAQHTGETVSGMKTTAGDSERGHKGRAACLHSFDPKFLVEDPIRDNDEDWCRADVDSSLLIVGGVVENPPIANR
ncbi:hypothetical protein DPMN_169144 [Dreissena polymorpha]|uniref:Uncharacterized protein n=1 Tax=Dreissena polymorpha TaxID=45954 RepID=A0A9D4F410_DREPO|nr:hypothetical protein DPMN_169144 [Dreissena polymorpha]